MIDYGVGGKSQTKKISKAHKRINKTRLKVNVRSAFTLTCSLGECADRLWEWNKAIFFCKYFGEHETCTNV